MASDPIALRIRLHEGRARKPSNWRWPSAGLVGGLGLAITLSGWHFAAAKVEQAVQHKFETETRAIEHDIRSRLSLYENSLWGAAALVNARGGRATRSEWRRYVDGLDLDKRYPGILGIGFSARVPAAELERHIAAVRAEGFPAYHIRPDARRDEYHSIIYLEPFSGRNLRAFGYDMFSDPTRRAAMQRARDAGQTAVSGRVTLVQETDQDVQAGFLMYVPVYRPGMPLQSVEQRRAALIGFAYSPFRVEDLMEGTLGPRSGGIRYEIYDGTVANAPDLMYRSQKQVPVSPRPMFESSRVIGVAGHPWHIRFTSMPDFESTFERAVPGIVLALGISVSLLLFAIANSLVRTRARAEGLARQAEDRAAELEQAHDRLKLELVMRQRVEGERNASEERFRYLFANNPTPKWVYDDVTCRFLEVNEAAVQKYGYSREEFRAMTIFDIRPSEEVEVLKRHGGAVLGEGLHRSGPWIHRLRDGTLIEVEIHAHRFEWNGRRAVLVVTHDVTERRRAQAELLRLNERLEQRVAERTTELQALNRELEAFSYSVSHDLRSPVTAINGFSQMLKESCAGELGEDGLHLLERITGAAKRMELLIQGLLSLGQVKNQELQREPVDLGELSASLARELRGRDPGREAEFVIQPGLIADADPALAHAVLQNLLGNAWKFTRGRPAARIEIGSVAAEGKAAFYVKDNGAGFDPACASRLFRPFQRLHNTAQFEGTGVGLSIVARIVERHGGRIWAESRPGEGACFFFTLC